MANGADRISVYTPMFRTLSADETAVTIVVFVVQGAYTSHDDAPRRALTTSPSTFHPSRARRRRPGSTSCDPCPRGPSKRTSNAATCAASSPRSARDRDRSAGSSHPILYGPRLRTRLRVGSLHGHRSRAAAERPGDRRSLDHRRQHHRRRRRFEVPRRHSGRARKHTVNGAAPLDASAAMPPPASRRRVGRRPSVRPQSSHGGGTATSATGAPASARTEVCPTICGMGRLSCPNGSR